MMGTACSPHTAQDMLLLVQRCGRQPDDISSIVLVELDACHIKSKAILKIGQSLRQPFPVLATPLFVLPGILRDAFYDQVRTQPDALVLMHCRLK